MWFNRIFKRKKPAVPPEETHEQPDQPERIESAESGQSSDSSIDKGVYYLYLIIGAQVFLVFAIAAVIMVVGKIIMTPLWVFLFAFLIFTAGIVYVYRKAKQQFQRLRESISRMDFSDKNVEISIMGGMLTMRLEQNSRRLLEAPPTSATPLIEAEVIEPENPPSN